MLQLTRYNCLAKWLAVRDSRVQAAIHDKGTIKFRKKCRKDQPTKDDGVGSYPVFLGCEGPSKVLDLAAQTDLRLHMMGTQYYEFVREATLAGLTDKLYVGFANLAPKLIRLLTSCFIVLHSATSEPSSQAVQPIQAK